MIHIPCLEVKKKKKNTEKAHLQIHTEDEIQYFFFPDLLKNNEQVENQVIETS